MTSESRTRAPARAAGALERAIIALEQAKSKISRLERAQREPIAVVGIGCRFPGGASGPAAYFEQLRRRTDAIQPIGPDRWPVGDWPNLPGTRWAGLIEGIGEFDAEFFGVSPREAQSMDPQQRVLLEVVYEALEDGALPIDRLSGSRTGVFVGSSNLDYSTHAVWRELDELDVYATTGNSLAFLAGRVSYSLGLMGPALTVDTACSSSLVTVHLAMESLRNGECDFAVAAGVNLILSPRTMYLLAQTQALSPDARCRAFDAKANGIVRGEGAGAVVLRRLADAQRDGDPIVGLLLGSAVNQDGRSTGMTAPNPLAQVEVIHRALARAGVGADEIDYVEAHGTGTSLGDPIELEALKMVFGDRRGGESCRVGSVKTNLGHLEAAAGIAGLIKVLLAMREQLIPGNLHFETLNPRIDLSNMPLAIAGESVPWPRGARPRTAGVSAFGLSGTNAHVVVREAPVVKPKAATAGGPPGGVYVLPISARCSGALDDLARAWCDLLARGEGPALDDLAFSAAQRLSHHEHRLAVVGEDRESLHRALASHLAGEVEPSVARGRGRSAEREPVVFVFAGQGSQWGGMGRELLASEPEFSAAMQECDALVEALTGWSLLRALANPEDTSYLESIDRIQPMLSSIQISLARLWRARGVEPDAVVGQSMGEVAASHVAGVLTLREALTVICRRSHLLTGLRGVGGMVAVELSEDTARQLLAPFGDRISIAVYGGPRSLVLAGEASALLELEPSVVATGSFWRPVRIDGASHCALVDRFESELYEALSELRPQPPRIPLYSSVEGDSSSELTYDASYWVRNLREPVRVWDAIQALTRDGHSTFVELGPHPLLLSLVADGLRRRAGGPAESEESSALIPSMIRDQPERLVLARALGALHVQGASVDWERCAPEGRPARLPSYPWQRTHHWVPRSHQDGARGIGVSGPGAHPLLGGHVQSAIEPSTHLWQRTVSLEGLGYLREHRLGDTPLFPGAGYLELMSAAAREVLGRSGLVDVRFERPLLLTEEEPRVLQVSLVEGAAESELRVSSRTSASLGGAWILHARAKGQRRGVDEPSPEAWESVPPSMAGSAERSGRELYEALTRRGFHFGPAFRGVERVSVQDGAVLGRLTQTAEVEHNGERYGIHPAHLDAALQVGAAAVEEHGEGLVIATGLDGFELWQPGGRAAWSHARARSTPGGHAMDIELRDARGGLVASIRGLQSRRLAEEERSISLSDYRSCWIEAGVARRAAEESRRTIVVLADKGGFAVRLERALRDLQRRVVVVDTTEPAVATVGRLDGSLQVVDLSWLDLAAPGEQDHAALAEEVGAKAVDVVGLLGALQERKGREPPELCIITRGAVAVDEASVRGPLAAAAWGLGRTVGAEYAGVRSRRIDVSGPRDVGALAAELSTGSSEDEVALREGSRFVARIRPEPLVGLEALRLDAEGVYVVGGGPSPECSAIAAALARAGAEQLVLVSGAEPEAAVLESLQQRGVEVEVVVSSEPQALEAIVCEHARSGRLRGLVLGVEPGQGALAEPDTRARGRAALVRQIEAMLRISGALGGRAPGLLLLCVSPWSLLGGANRGLSLAAEAALAALARHPSLASLGAVAVRWSLAVDVAAADTSAHGIVPLSRARIEQVLGTVLDVGRPVVSPFSFTYRHWSQLNPSYCAAPRFSELEGLEGAQEPGGAPLRDTLDGLDPAARLDATQRAVARIVARVLRKDSSSLAKDTPLQNLGIDSLMSLEIRNLLELRLGLTLPATLVWTYPTVRRIAEYLCARLDGSETPGRSTGQQADPEAHDPSVEERSGTHELSDDEALELLGERADALEELLS